MPTPVDQDVPAVRPELDQNTAEVEQTPLRTNGFAPLRSYAAIGDGRTVALVAQDGAIDWLPLPDLDSLPVFAAILDERNGGRLELIPTVAFESQRSYLTDTNVLQTTFTTAAGRVRVTDALNVGVAGRLPWTELARRVDGIDGEVPMRWRVAPGTCFDTASPWARQTPYGTVLRVQELSLGVCVSEGMDVELTDQSAFGTFTVKAGERKVIGVIAAHAEPLMLSPVDDIDRGIDRTVAAWRDWSAQFECAGDWHDAVRRSALALKLLIFSPTGAIAAAATTSLPESLAGGKNWDYRYAWIRDTAYALDALRRFGLREETHASISWLLRTLRDHGPELGVFYRLDGSESDGTTTHDVPGWHGIGPVTTGNPAGGQLQLGTFA
ncbi:MAG: glycoside hydrolase family 15 protein, partial [Mycobacterium sp.]